MPPISHAFFLVDSDKDGHLTNDKIQATIAGVEPQRVKSADSNGDGKMSMYEFRKAIAQHFDTAHTNADGRLSMQEVKDMS